MNIIIDHQIFFQNRFGGISKIFLEILRRLRERNINVETSVKVDSYSRGILIDRVTNEQINLPGCISLYRVYKIIERIYLYFGFSLPEFLIKRERGIFKFSLRKQIKKIEGVVCNELLSNDFTIFHPTYFQSYYLDALENSRTKMIITVYDCVHELFPEYYGDSNFILKNRQKLCEIADHIICISHTTKNDLLRLYPSVSKEKVSVIYLAGDLSSEMVISNNLPFNEYLLFVGNRSDYKNFSVLLNAFSILREEEQIYLLCVGGGGFSLSEQKSIENLGLGDSVYWNSIISDAQLASFYRNASLFIYPSLYEGFGIPLLESMSVGCPVLCSNIEVFYEVAGDAASYFDPKDPIDLKNKIKEILSEKHLKEKLIRQGFDRVKNFSWNRCADQHILIYESLSQLNAN
ncbi:glycosyltransferase family 1 protein [Leptospira bouyouniensis]|uniref:Glycosyltransferase family 1 protein n=1 Tax=Leptospira bouyouniensis TaxID=2484911 RepID=A0A7I0IMV6_9LEPT|nr:glycosyltransferase family 1 protein [Leptospira bouyouniensis]TGL04526.1 glycosyltransferase family 1 protein [Leptospira bouyouniensis]